MVNAEPYHVLSQAPCIPCPDRHQHNQKKKPPETIKISAGAAVIFLL